MVVTGAGIPILQIPKGAWRGEDEDGVVVDGAGGFEAGMEAEFAKLHGGLVQVANVEEGEEGGAKERGRGVQKCVVWGISLYPFVFNRIRVVVDEGDDEEFVVDFQQVFGLAFNGDGGECFGLFWGPGLENMQGVALGDINVLSVMVGFDNIRLVHGSDLVVGGGGLGGGVGFSG